MSISVQDAIKLVQNFEEKLKSRAIAWKENPHMYYQSVDTIKNIIKQSEGNQLKFANYNEMRNFMISKKILDNIEKTQIQANIKTMENPALETKGLFTYKNLKRYYKEWEKKEKYLQVPPNFLWAAAKEVENYAKFIERSNMPESQKTMILHNLQKKNIIPKAKEYFYKTLQESKRIYNLVLKDTENRHSLHSDLLNNVYFSLRELPRNWRAPIWNICFWLKTLEQKREYQFSPNSVMEFVDGFLQFRSVSQKERNLIRKRREQLRLKEEEEQKALDKAKLKQVEENQAREKKIREASEQKMKDIIASMIKTEQRAKEQLDHLSALDNIQEQVGAPILEKIKQEATATLRSTESEIEKAQAFRGGNP